MYPPQRREQRGRTIIDEGNLRPQPLHMVYRDIERASEPDQVAEAAPRPFDPKALRIGLRARKVLRDLGGIHVESPSSNLRDADLNLP